MKDSSNDREKWSSIGGVLFNLVKSIHTRAHTYMVLRVTNSCAESVWRYCHKSRVMADFEKKKSRRWLISSPLSKGVYTIYDVSWNGNYRWGDIRRGWNWSYWNLSRWSSLSAKFYEIVKFCCEERRRKKEIIRSTHAFIKISISNLPLFVL